MPVLRDSLLERGESDLLIGPSVTLYVKSSGLGTSLKLESVLGEPLTDDMFVYVRIKIGFPIFIGLSINCQ